MRIRAARPDESETLFAIQKTAALAAYAHIFPPDRFPFPEDEERASWQRRLSDPAVTTLVAEREAHPVGYIAFTDDQIDSLFVLPDAQAAGVGSALLDAAVDAQRAAGTQQSRLWVLAKNRPARRFYERRGWYADGQARQTAFPPHPLVLGYALDLASGAP